MGVSKARLGPRTDLWLAEVLHELSTDSASPLVLRQAPILREQSKLAASNTLELRCDAALRLIGAIAVAP